MKRVILIIMDSFGIGASADADQFGGEGYNDVGSNTFGHIAQAFARGEADSSERSGPIQFPHLNQLGLGRREKGRRREKGQARKGSMFIFHIYALSEYFFSHSR